MLCPSCQRKLQSGEISKKDLEVAQLLLSLENTYPPIQDVYFYKTVDTKHVLAILVGQGDMASFLSYGGKLLKELSQKVGKSVRILEYGTPERKFLEDLFAPLSIVTINRIWLPDGSIQTRVILRKRGRQPSQRNLDALKIIANRLRGLTLRIEFTT